MQTSRFIPYQTLCIFIVSFFYLNYSNALDTESKVIKIEAGLLSGIAGNDPSITVFKGIPFASPPIGELRWQPPQPVTPWKGVFKAHSFSKSCMQNETRRFLPWTEEYMPANDYGEDCLALNVWAHSEQADNKLKPVLVYIHGGAYTGGSGEVLIYNGENLAKKGIVVVTINYRLGIFGFLSHPTLSKNSPNDSSGNYGLLDNIAALQWVHKNISALGGDPGNVTIAGQSAGASSVHYLTASPLAKGLFHKAIAQSGARSKIRKTDSLTRGQQKTIHYMKKWKINSLDELRSLKAETLQGFNIDFSNRFLPVIEGWVLPNSIVTQHQTQQYNDVPMLMGLTADEGSSSPSYGVTTVVDYKMTLQQKFGPAYDKALKFYPGENDQQAGESLKQIARDRGRLNMLDWAIFRDKYGESPSYLYYMKRITPWPEYPQYGAFHSSELPYTFNNQHLINRPWEAGDKKLADIMSSYWLNFIKHGDPNGKSLPEWSTEQNMMMQFDLIPGTTLILDAQKIKLLRSYKL